MVGFMFAARLWALGLVLVTLFFMLTIVGLVVSGVREASLVGLDVAPVVAGGVVEHRLGIYAPGDATFTLYYSNPLDRPVIVSILVDGRVVLEDSVAPGGRGMVGTLVLEGGGAKVVVVRVHPEGGLGGFEEQVILGKGLEVYGSGEQGYGWVPVYALVAVLSSLALFLPILALSRGVWLFLQPPLYLGLFSAVLVLYYSGGPGVGIVDFYGAGFGVYMRLRPFWDPELLRAVAVLSVITGSLAIPYSRGVDLEALEHSLGVWGWRLLAARLLFVVAGFLVGLASSILALALVGLGLSVVAWAGHLGAFALFLLRDLVGAVAVASGLAVLAGGLSYALRQPILVLVVLVMALVVALPLPRFTGGGMGLAVSGGVVEVEFRYDWGKLAPALRFGFAAWLAGILGLAVGWLRR